MGGSIIQIGASAGAAAGVGYLTWKHVSDNPIAVTFATVAAYIGARVALRGIATRVPQLAG